MHPGDLRLKQLPYIQQLTSTVCLPNSDAIDYLRSCAEQHQIFGKVNHY